jgi:hypothetical protein
VRLYLLWLTLFLSCVSQQPDEFSKWEEQSIKKLLIEDKANKELELMYLGEIKKAEENNDTDSYKFYLQEYMKIPRLDIQEEFKSRPDYFIGGDRVKY